MLKAEIKDVEEIKEQIYYKVVSEHEGKLYSAMINTQILKYNRYHYRHDLYSNLDKLNVEYIVDEWVKPKIKNTRLCVFTSLYGANRFLYGITKGRIYSCHIKGYAYLPGPISKQQIDNGLIRKVKHLWDTWMNGECYLYDWGASATEVKLIERLK